MCALPRVYYQNGCYLVSVRYPGQWHNIREFIQPGNPDVVAVYYEVGPDVWASLDWVCRNISYRQDIGEWWSWPSETINRATGDCEDSAILTCSLLRNFTNAYTVLGGYHGLGHAWVADGGGEILEATYTEARAVPDPEAYKPMVMFNDVEVLELYPGALAEVFQLGRDEATKLGLMAEAVGNEVPPECPSCWPFMVAGLAMGGILGTGFAMILQKGE